MAQLKKPVSTWVWVVLVTAFAAFAGFFVWFYYGQMVNDSTLPTPISVSKSTSTSSPTSTADWKTYSDSTYNLNFKYPPAYNVSLEGKDIYIRNDENYWLYIITFEQNSTNKTLDQIAKVNFDQLSDNIAAESSSITFSRTDIVVGGIDGKKMTTRQQVAYSPSARVILIKDNNIIKISPRDDSIEFNTFLSTFQFTP